MAAAARSTVTNEIVWVDDIKSGQRPVLPGEKFKCVVDECSALVQLKAEDSDKVTPYFAEISGKKPHMTRCPGRNVSKRNALGSDRELGVPERYPSKLVLRDSESRGNSSSEQAGSRLPRAVHGEESHHQISTVLGKVVRWFLQNPTSADARLEIDGCWQKTYGQIFRYLSFAEGKILIGQHIFYAELEFKNNIVEHKDRLEFKVRMYEAGRSSRSATVILETHGLDEVRKNFAKKLVMESTEAKKAHWLEAKNKGGRSSWKSMLFFLGVPDDKEPDIFHVKHYKGIYACALDMPRLKLNSYNHVKDLNCPSAPLPKTQSNPYSTNKTSDQEQTKVNPGDIPESGNQGIPENINVDSSAEKDALLDSQRTSPPTQSKNSTNESKSAFPSEKKSVLKRFLDWLK